MRGKIFKEIDMSDKKKKLFSILTRLSKNKLTIDEINHIVNNLDITRQYSIECINDRYAFSENVTLETNIKFDVINGSRGHRTVLHDVLLLDKINVVNVLDENKDIINEFKKGLYIIDDGKFIIGCNKIIGLCNGEEVLNEDIETKITQFDINKKICVISEYMEWNHINTDIHPTNRMKLSIYIP